LVEKVGVDASLKTLFDSVLKTLFDSVFCPTPIHTRHRQNQPGPRRRLLRRNND